MSISKEERQQARIDIRSWGADEKPELVERLLNALDEADSEKAELQKENRRVVEGAAREGSDAEAELAPALGYEYDEEYGWVTGDHTSVTLAMEARRKIGELQQENERLHALYYGEREAHNSRGGA